MSMAAYLIVPLGLTGAMHRMRRLPSLFRGQKIRSRLLRIQLMILSLFLLVSLGLIYYLIGTYNRSLYQETAHVLNLSTSAIENELRRIEALTFQGVADPKVQEHGLLLLQSTAEFDRFREMRMISERINLLVAHERNVQTVLFIDMLGSQYVTGRYPSTLNPQVLNQVMQSAAKQQGAAAIRNPSADESSLLLARQLRTIRDLDLSPLGIIVLRVELDALMKQNLTLIPGYDLDLLVYADGIPVYTPPQIQSIDFDLLGIRGTSGYSIRKIHGQRFFVAYTVSRYTDFIYVNMMPYESMFQASLVARNSVIVSFLTLLLMCMFAAVQFAARLTKPLEQLSEKMRIVESGNFDLEWPKTDTLQSLDEIGHLQKDFHIMVQKINTLIKEDHTKELAVKDAQYQALQAQINPHFLYNTLESINWMAKMNGQTDISRMVEALGYLLRSSISKREHIIPVSEELRILESYLTIQKIRYEERLEYSLQVASTFSNVKIPKLTLQPIVENSINYGLENMLEACRIQIAAAAEEGCLVFRIEDNGPGIESDLQGRLYRGEISPKGSGIGLKNIHDRIQMMFGSRYGLCIEQAAEGGTLVTVAIPLKEGELHV